MTDPLDVEITLRSGEAPCYTVSLRALLPGQDVPTEAEGTAPVDPVSLHPLLINPPAYGKLLRSQLFADHDVYAAFVLARASAENAPGGPRELRVRLRIDTSAGELHNLRWELLCDPISGAALCTGEKLFFSRYLPGKGIALRPRPKAAMRALAAVAAPGGLTDFGLAEIDTEGEIERGAAALDGITIDRLPAAPLLSGVAPAEFPSAPGDRCSLEGLAACLRGDGSFNGYDVLYLTCHGRIKDGEAYLALDDGQNRPTWVKASDLADRLAELLHPPRLVVLAACEGAGAEISDALAAAGPRLIAAGIPAVLAMQGKVFMKTVAAFLPVFFRELARDGVIDRAVAVARGSIRTRPDWSAPVLFMRLVSGRLWTEEISLPEPAALPVPHQIPPPSEDFVGREVELAMLKVAIEVNKEPVVGISGMGGMGKTALALKLAGRMLPNYPAGQIYFDYGESFLRSATAMDALAHILRTFQPQMQLPQNLGELKAMYQSMLFERPVMILLDNVRAEDQLEPLLPPPPGCLVIITSWRRLYLPGLYDLSLGELSDEDAQKMLLDLAPDIASPALALELANACGKMPQAIQVVASLLRVRPDLTADDLVRRMQDEADRLELSGMDPLLEVSYGLLSEPLQQPWKMLAIFAGDFDAYAAAWLWGLHDESTPANRIEKQVDTARDRLGKMLEHSLLNFDKTTRRYQMYKLAQTFAARKMEPSDRQTSLRLHARYFIRVLMQANDLFRRGGDQALDALALFDRERREITAAQAWAAAGNDDDSSRLSLCNQYAAYGGNCLVLRFTPAEQVVWLEAGLRAARVLKDRSFEGIHLGNLGNAIQELKGPKDAIVYFKQQLAIAKEVGDYYSQINALSSLGLAMWKQGRPKSAIPYHRRGLNLARKKRDRAGEARALGNLGVAYHDLGNTTEAVSLYERQLAISRQIFDLQQESNALNNLGIEYAALGDPSRAQDSLNQALAINKKLGDRSGYGRTLDSLGSLYQKQDSLEQARQTFNDAIHYQEEAYDRQGAAITRWNLGELLLEMGEKTRAIELMELAITYEIEIDHPDAVKHQKRLLEVKK